MRAVVPHDKSQFDCVMCWVLAQFRCGQRFCAISNEKGQILHFLLLTVFSYYNGARCRSWQSYGSSKRCYQYHLTKGDETSILHTTTDYSPAPNIAALFVTRICGGKSELLLLPDSHVRWVRVVLYGGTTSGFHCTCWISKLISRFSRGLGPKTPREKGKSANNCLRPLPPTTEKQCFWIVFLYFAESLMTSASFFHLLEQHSVWLEHLF